MTNKELKKCVITYGWYYTSWNKELTVNQIDKYANEINWNYISLFQKLNAYLIDKYKNRINIANLLNNTQIDNQIKNKIEIGVFYE